MEQRLSDRLCAENLWKIVERARQYDNFVWIDMEAVAYTDASLRIYQELRSCYRQVDIALQTNLFRTSKDLDLLMSIGGTVQLCKGGHQESDRISFKHRQDIDQNYIWLAERLLSSGKYQAFGTHDEKMIRHVIEFAATHGIAKEAFEFQMGHGMRPDLQAQMLKDGFHLRLYVVYGYNWYPYFMRRLAEHPANIILFLQSLSTLGRVGEPCGAPSAAEHVGVKAMRVSKT